MKLIETACIPILLTGEGDLLASVAVSLVDAGHEVKVHAQNLDAFVETYDRHSLAKQINCNPGKRKGSLILLTELTYDSSILLAIAILPENLEHKISHLMIVERLVPAESVIAINTETYSITELSAVLRKPERLIGLNWTEPAHTTFFLEIISNEANEALAQDISALAKQWGKDSYVVQNSGVRSLLLSAMAREASYLVDNGYASVEDIDRACRNDTGYYLPFAGNCRYMDLMGTYAYGMVMKDLNPELSKDKSIPEFFKEIEADGGLGMENGKGFYNYVPEEVNEWKEKMEQFSYKINKIIDKYPFNYNVDSYLD